ADRNRSHWSTSKTPSYTKSVSWQHHRPFFSLFSEKDTQNLYLEFSCLSDRLTELLSMLTKKEQLVIRREYACHHPGG
ncbi:hypothetical protein VSP73_03500, partial [Escherichia coli]|uniref:hypothetical protein n=3 Tax=Escherichia coli TaxID=562 RepID=UPI002DBDCB80